MGPTHNHPTVYTLIYLCSLFFFPLDNYAQIQIGGRLHIAEKGVMHIAYTDTYLHGGKITTTRSGDYGYLSLAQHSQVHNADHNAHVDGVIRMYGPEQVIFVTGNDNVFQPARLINLNNPKPVDLSFTFIPHTHDDREDLLVEISNRFYWSVHHGEAEANLSLSWNAFSGLDALTKENLNNLSIAGFDGTQWRVIESEVDPEHFYGGGTPTLLNGSISSVHPVNLAGYSAFTLARINVTNFLNVSQGFTPNGDGINDTWHIENIEQFPQAKIRVYSRWQRLVYSQNGLYRNDWDGHYKGGALPDASYFYTIDRDADGFVDQSGWIYITH